MDLIPIYVSLGFGVGLSLKIPGGESRPGSQNRAVAKFSALDRGRALAEKPLPLECGFSGADQAAGAGGGTANSRVNGGRR